MVTAGDLVDDVVHQGQHDAERLLDARGAAGQVHQQPAVLSQPRQTAREHSGWGVTSPLPAHRLGQTRELAHDQASRALRRAVSGSDPGAATG